MSNVPVASLPHWTWSPAYVSLCVSNHFMTPGPASAPPALLTHTTLKSEAWFRPTGREEKVFAAQWTYGSLNQGGMPKFTMLINFAPNEWMKWASNFTHSLSCSVIFLQIQFAWLGMTVCVYVCTNCKVSHKMSWNSPTSLEGERAPGPPLVISIPHYFVCV